MSVFNSTSTQQPAAICALKSPADAIHILEAVRLGLVPRVTRRLTGHERAMIRPGTVWVWEEEETNMRRWTDGRRWGASRVGGGGFLVYTESSESVSPPRPDSPYYNGYYQGSSKTEGLIKQTYSTSTNQSGKTKKFHVVAYSSKHNPQGDAHNPLPLPHQLPLLANIKIVPGVWPEWEHRRDNDTRRQDTTTPQTTPTTAIPSPDSQMPAFPPTAYPAPRSPKRQHPYYPSPQQPPYPTADRYHPYARPPRPSYPPSPYPQEIFDAEGRRISPQGIYYPYPAPSSYPAPPPPEAYRRDFYEMPMASPIIDSNGNNVGTIRYPITPAPSIDTQDRVRISPNQDLMNRSPGLGISAAMDGSTGGGPINLPPLRVAIDEQGQQRVSPPTTGKVPSPKDINGGIMVQ